ncbi:MAG: hypothetical protein K6E73_07060 [Bacteroidales bacterium]|nr:hypothetical protein [Bacteroidales bacterium]
MSLIKDYIKRLYAEYLYYRYKRIYEKDPRLAAYGLYDRIYGNHDNFDIDNPKSLLEKITWLELNSDTSLWTLCADKYRMREYVAQCGLEDHLPSLYGHWDNPNDIDFSSLPHEFVLKANNGCGTVKIVRDKDKLNEKKVKKELKRWLKHKFGYMGAQTHYLSIKPCILAEELLHQSDEQNAFSPNSLIDYKVWCLNGKPECILVVYGRTSNNHLLDMYDTNWERIPNSLKHNKSYGVKEDKFPRPSCLEEMLEMAAVLSKPFPEVRVDFYVVKEKPVIGELTFTSGYGNYTDDFYNYLGSKIDLSKVKRKDE